MERWWDDAEQSRRALERVRSSDAASVGAVLLAYHGVASACLRPLAGRTCVDAGMVSDALDGVDVSGVAKALAVATSSVMGDAAEAYGLLLAREVHERAVDGTTRLLSHLTSTGMDWPTAITRVAGVHGVPAGHLGPVAKRLKADRLSGVPLADACDRALMAYAQRFGERECGPLGAVSKGTLRRAREFDESDHRRDSLGRFTDKPGDRRAYLDRKRQMRERRDRQAADREQARIDRIRPEDRRLRRQAEQPLQPERRRRDAVEQPVADRRLRRTVTSGDTPLTGDEQLPGHLTYDTAYFLVPRDVAEWMALADDGFSVDWLAKQSGSGVLWATSRDQIERDIATRMHALRSSGDSLWDRYTLVMIDGNVAWAEDADPRHSKVANIRLAPGGVYRAVPYEGFSPDDVAGVALSNRAGLRSIVEPIPNIVIRLSNEHQFQSYDWTPVRSKKRPVDYDDDGLPHDRFGKSLQRRREFDERDHRRDVLGRFADKPGGSRDRQDARREYLQRKQAARDRSARAARPPAVQERRLRNVQQEQAALSAERRRRPAVEQRAASESSSRRLGGRTADRVQRSGLGDELRRRRDALREKYRPWSSVTVVFDDEQSAGTFEYLFGRSLGGEPASYERSSLRDEDDMRMFASQLAHGTPVSLGDWAMRTHDSMVGDAAGNRMFSVGGLEAEMIFTDEGYMSADEALSEAMEVCDDYNQSDYGDGGLWFPYVFEESEGNFVPMAVYQQDSKLPSLLVADSDQDMADFRRSPWLFTVKPLSGSWDDTSVMFDEVFLASASLDSWASYAENASRPDIRIRPFLLERRRR